MLLLLQIWSLGFNHHLIHWKSNCCFVCLFLLFVLLFCFLLKWWWKEGKKQLTMSHNWVCVRQLCLSKFCPSPEISKVFIWTFLVLFTDQELKWNYCHLCCCCCFCFCFSFSPNSIQLDKYTYHVILYWCCFTNPAQRLNCEYTQFRHVFLLLHITFIIAHQHQSTLQGRETKISLQAEVPYAHPFSLIFLAKIMHLKLYFMFTLA